MGVVGMADRPGMLRFATLTTIGASTASRKCPTVQAVMAIVAAAAVCGCASVPDDGRPLTDAESATVAMSEPVPGVLVCELAGRDEVVQVRRTDEGTRYTVCAHDGRIVERDLDAAELSRIRPDLDADGMQADWGFGPLMMVDVGD